MPPKHEPPVTTTVTSGSFGEDILRVALPVSWAASLAFLVAVLALGMWSTQPSRVIPPALALIILTGGGVARRAGRPRLAAGSVLVAVFAATAAGMLLNEGLRAPVSVFLVFVVASSTWVFGKRAATWFAVGASGFATLIFLLERAGLLPGPGVAPLGLELTVLLLAIWLIWTASVLPYHRMTVASEEAAQRHRALVEEQERRKQADLAFKAVLDQSSHYLLLVDPAGIVLSANQGAVAYMHLKLESEIIGRRLIETPWCSPEARGALEECLRKAATTRETARFQAVTHFEGSRRIIDHSLSPFLEASGRLRYLIAEGRDVTEIVAGQQSEARARRLELIGQLAGGVAHDFNNVLMAILGSAELLALELGDTLTPEQREHLETITTAGRRAGDLTRRLLEVGRRSSIDKRPLSLHALLASVARLLTRLLPANIKLELRLQATGDLVNADAAGLESAFINIAVNARDAMRAGGTLTLTTEDAQLDEAQCRASGFELTPGRYIRVSAQDTGTGIPPAVQPRVFDPFFTTKPMGQGTGLGLASVFGMVSGHRGSIHLVSEEGRGTVFHLQFPLVPAAQPAPAPTTPGPQPLNGLRALVVDDETPIRTMLALLLGRAGVTCTIAADAEAGLVEFQRAPEAFDFAVLDLVLPGRSGSQLAQQLLQQSPRLKVVLMSGFPKDAEVDCFQPGQVQLLGKPFTFETLQSTLASLLAGRSAPAG